MDSCPLLRSRRIFSLAAAPSLLAACSPEAELVDGVLTQPEWERIQPLSPLPDASKEPSALTAA